MIPSASEGVASKIAIDENPNIGMGCPQVCIRFEVFLCLAEHDCLGQIK